MTRNLTSGKAVDAYRVAVKDFYGKGKLIHDSKKMTVVIRLLAFGTSLTDLKRFYVQRSNAIP
ncbi:hypothetical protein N0V86_007762 [Didymella sp. IMI 355093]|nr:hypothetical protein N0V86_007762 [Didymella sp. IMI 355093]